MEQGQGRQHPRRPGLHPVVAATDSGGPGVASTVGVRYYQLGASSSGPRPTAYFIKRFSAVAAGVRMERLRSQAWSANRPRRAR